MQHFFSCSFFIKLYYDDVDYNFYGYIGEQTISSQIQLESYYSKRTILGCFLPFYLLL